LSTRKSAVLAHFMERLFYISKFQFGE